MTIPTLIRAEFSRLTASTLARVALVALVLVPVIYGGLYLWANRDPYASLDKVPAALVVDDAGATVDGRTVDYGTRVASQVVNDGRFDWKIVSAATAAAGVRDGTFDFSLTMPAEFSARLTSSSGTRPQQGTVVLTTNDTNSYLATTIAGQAAATIRSSIAEQVGEAAANRFLLGFSGVRANLAEAIDGTTRLHAGASDAAAGARALADGAARAAAGAHTLSSGLTSLTAKTATLPTETATLAAGAARVAVGTARLAAIGDTVAAKSSQAVTAVEATRAALNADLLSAGLTPDQASAALTRLDPLATGAATANTDLMALRGQLDTLAAGSSAVSAGAQQLSAATPALRSGIAGAAYGASTLATGASTAASGATSLMAGLDTLSTGVTRLGDGLSSGLGQIPSTDAAGRAAQASTIANPVAVTATAVTSAGNYGAGLAPFFISLAAWIGIYALFLIVTPLSKRALTAVRRPVRIALAGWLTPAILGAVQMAGLYLIVTVLLGFTVEHPLAMYGFMALASAAFAAILLALNAWLGSVGQFVGLVLMVVQLVVAGGTFPWQTLPAPLAALHQVLPMSSAVDGLRQLMYGGSLGTAWTDAAVLACWLLGGLLVTVARSARLTRYRTINDLRPSLIG